MSEKVKPSELQERVLALIDQHVAILEQDLEEYLKQKDDDAIAEKDKKKFPSYFSSNLTGYLKSLSDYQEAKDDGIGRQLKALQKMSTEQLQKMKEEFDNRNK